MTAPLLSFIVLSYNYENYIRVTLDSILAQTVSDFEVVVVDDCSTDNSRAVIRSYADPRIRLIENERNLGGAGSYNVAVSAARGEWLVNLDADDWITPDKCERQLAAIAADPSIDIIGGWVKAVDGAGARHPKADEIEGIVNRPYDLNLSETWIGQNPLCRSSTMVRRAMHMRIGLDDSDMIRAPDYELWTRALAHGARFALLHEPLTYMRQHARGVTHGDPAGTLLEMSFAMIRNLSPLAESRCIFDAQAEVTRFIAKNANLITLTPLESLRLLGCSVTLPAFAGFRSFRDFVAETTPDPVLERIGRHALLGAATYVAPGTLEKLYTDIGLFVEARDYWQNRASMLSDETGRFMPLKRFFVSARYFGHRLANSTPRQLWQALRRRIRRYLPGRR